MSEERVSVSEWIHDLRSPLTGISGFAQLIDDSNDIDQIHRWSEKIIRAASALEAVVAEMSEAFGVGSSGTESGPSDPDTYP